MYNLFTFFKKHFLLISLLITTTLVGAINCHDKPCCSKKCTGSEYCTACKNCSACAYCNSGGYCGVCRPEAYRKTVVKPQVKTKQQMKSKPQIQKK